MITVECRDLDEQHGPITAVVTDRWLILLQLPTECDRGELDPDVQDAHIAFERAV